MRATREYRAVAFLAATLAALAVLIARPLLLAGAVGLAAYLVATQYAFFRGLHRTRATLVVDQSIDRNRTVVEEPVTVTLTASLSAPAPLSVEVEADLPVAATDVPKEHRTVAVDRHGHSARSTFAVSVPVAGAFEVGPPTVTATGLFGLLSETLRIGPTATLTVEPRGPRDVHVGEGGERIAAAFGEHPAGRLGPGFAPMELREYVHGDAASRIDWKATARLNRPYVREDEAETDHVTVLLVDHRATMGAGPPGETKLDYARQAALAVANSAREHDDPLGCFAVGDGGLTVSRSPGSAPEGYAAIRRDLHDLAVTATPQPTHAHRHGPADARDRADRLQGTDSPFARTLRPFLDDAPAYVHRIEDEPLFRVARTSVGRLRGSVWTMVFTDDTDRAEVREAVKVARRGDDHVVVFLTPDVLFEPGGLADLESAYERYREFESFRRDLARMDRVSAFEVAPGDRIEAVLDARRRRRTDRGRA